MYWRNILRILKKFFVKMLCKGIAGFGNFRTFAVEINGQTQ